MASIVILTILVFTTVVYGDKVQKKTSHVKTDRLVPFGSALTCQCAVQGVEGPTKEALRRWLHMNYLGGQPDSSICQGYTCYRVDFVNVYDRTIPGLNHYTVLGCMDAMGLAQGGVDFKMQPNVSVDHFIRIPGVNAVAGQILEMQCSHPVCQQFEPVPWDWSIYATFIGRIERLSGGANAIGGPGAVSVLLTLMGALLAQSFN